MMMVFLQGYLVISNSTYMTINRGFQKAGLVSSKRALVASKKEIKMNKNFDATRTEIKSLR